ncbi:MAG: ribose 5-phosphate isomerase A, partial [Candidatus Omnitrophota bacterium]
MKKIYRITTITLIVMIIGVFLCQDTAYSFCLRIPLNIERVEMLIKDYEKEKRLASIEAAKIVREMVLDKESTPEHPFVLGIGGGTNIWDHAIDEVSKLGLSDRIVVISASDKSTAILEEKGLKVLSEVQSDLRIDLSLDGADEVSPEGYCIKGGGGCLTRELEVLDKAEKIIIIAESKKLVPELGKFFLPIDIKENQKDTVIERLKALGVTEFKFKTNEDGSLFRPDNGEDRLIINANFSGMLKNPPETANELRGIEGVVTQGIFFTDKPPTLVLIGENGTVKRIEPKRSGNEIILQQDQRDIEHLWDVKERGLEALSPEARYLLYNPDKAEWMKNFTPLVFYELYTFLKSPEERGVNFLKENKELFDFEYKNEHEALGDFLRKIVISAITRFSSKYSTREIEATYNIKNEVLKWLKERTGPGEISEFGQGDEHALTGKFGYGEINDYTEKIGKRFLDEWKLTGLARYYILRGETREAVAAYKVLLLTKIVGRTIVAWSKNMEDTRKKLLEFQEKGLASDMAPMSMEEIDKKYADISPAEFDADAIFIVRKELIRMQKEEIGGVEELIKG